jgi:deoxyribodipyrimidine photo-lyase
MSSPLSAEIACSRLSPYMAYGAITVREVVQITNHRQATLVGSRNGWLSSLASFQSRLTWSDHFIQKLEDQPDIESRCLHSAYEGLRPDVPDPTLLKAWKTGQTGVHFVDACMRFLTATGWLNFHMWAILVSFASYQLWLDWRVTG